MRFLFFFCFVAALGANTFANTPFLLRNAPERHAENGGPASPTSSVLTLEIDSIHHVNCLRPTGYLAVIADGGTPDYTYNWSNGFNGPVATSLSPGTYDITVTDANGATATVSATILQDLTPPLADAGADFTVTCTNSTATLNGSGSVGPEFSYLWMASSGGVIQSGATTLSPVISHTGVFTLKVTNSNNGCTASDAVIVGAIFPPPAVSATGGVINCAQPLVTLNAVFIPNNAIFAWQGPGGFMSNLFNPQVGIPGTYTIAVTDTITTCTGSANALVTIDTISPTATAGGGGVITCFQPTLTLTGNGTPVGVTFSWTGPNGFVSSLQNPVVSAPGTYQLIVTKPSNGCTATSSVDVTADIEPPTVLATASEDLTCVVFSVQLFGDATPANVTYAWTGPNGFNSNFQNPIVFGPGVYNLTVTKPSNGCTASASVTVNSNTVPPGATATGGVKTCANPFVTLMASSNTPGVTYLWTGPGGFNSTAQNPIASAVGLYTVKVTDPVNGCISSAVATLTQNIFPPNLTASSAIITCNNPMPQVSANSLTPGATFAWTGPNGFTANIANPQVSEAGIYVVTATNPANGCTRFLNIYVNENTTPPFVYAGEDRSLNCNFSTILANPLGTSTGNNFTYMWTTWNGNIVSGANTLYARFDTVGDYTLTVKNTQNGCVAADSMEVMQSPPMTATASQLTPVTCHAGNNGSAKAVPGGGSGFYTYFWSNGGHTATITGLGAGTYAVTVTDDEGCSATATATVTQPPALQAPVTTTPQTVFGMNDGTATVAPAGGTPPYTVQWSTGASTLTINALAPGVYTVTLTDSKSCTTTNTATVNPVNCAISGSITATNATCSNQPNGAAAANISGAANPVSYIWSNGAQTAAISSLPGGAYSVTATDVNGCSVVLSTQVTAPQLLVLTLVETTGVPCPDSAVGSITISSTGGVAPVSYAWPNGSTGTTASGLVAGSYICTMTDANGCTTTLSASIESTDQTPPQIVLKNATVALNANGTAAVTPDMFDNGSSDAECGIASLSVSPTVFDCGQIGAQTVTFMATDNNGNTATATATVTIVDTLAPTLICPANQTVPSCTVAVTFGLAQVSDNCLQNNSLALTNGLPSGSFFPIGTTQQAFSYTDGGGNTASCSFEIVVTTDVSVQPSVVPSTCTSVCDGSVTLNITGGGGSVSVAWDNGQSGSTASSLCPGSYTATLTDAAGCTQTYVAQVALGDVEAPVLACANDITVGYCNPVVVFSQPQVFDNCTVNPQQIELIAGLASGSTFPTGATTQTFRYTDAGGNTGECSFNVNVRLAPTIEVAYSNVTCADLCNGSATLTVSGDQAPFGISWSNGATDPTLSNLCPNSYTAIITDADGCQATRTVEIKQPPVLVLAVDQIVDNASSTGTGSIQISVNGGTPPYNYVWTLNGQPFAATEDLANLFAGQYAVVVIDSNGCAVASTMLNVGGLVSASEPDNAVHWALYPNPATAEVFLEMSDWNIGQVQLDIYDMAGRLLRQQEISPLGTQPIRIDLAELPDGLLLFRLAYEQGYQVKKLTKMR